MVLQLGKLHGVGRLGRILQESWWQDLASLGEYKDFPLCHGHIREWQYKNFSPKSQQDLMFGRLGAEGLVDCWIVLCSEFSASMEARLR